MASRRPPARWLLAWGALVVAGFLASFGLTYTLADGSGPESGVQETPAATPTPSPAPSSIGVDVSVPTSEDEPQATETVDPIKDTLRAPCPVTEIRFLFDREMGTLAVFSGDGQLIASVVRDSHIFEGELCRGVRAGVKRYSEDGDRVLRYESDGVSCSSPRGVDVEIHPTIWGATGRQSGNVLVVSVRDRPTVLASGIVVEDLLGRRFSYFSRHCAPL